jgi:hypothetical protein
MPNRGNEGVQKATLKRASEKSILSTPTNFNIIFLLRKNTVKFGLFLYY